MTPDLIDPAADNPMIGDSPTSTNMKSNNKINLNNMATNHVNDEEGCSAKIANAPACFKNPLF